MDTLFFWMRRGLHGQRTKDSYKNAVYLSKNAEKRQKSDSGGYFGCRAFWWGIRKNPALPDNALFFMRKYAVSDEYILFYAK